MNKTIRIAISLIITLFILSASSFGYLRGIYLTQSTLKNTSRLQSLIRQSRAVGLNTFVVDFTRDSYRYRQNIQLLKRNKIAYVARIVIFPGGGTRAQVRSKKYWDRKLRLISQAIQLGANAIQLDYIRYNTKQRWSSQNARDIYKVLAYYKKYISRFPVSMQVDVFGESAHRPSKAIGQNLKVFAPVVDVICPMVYPSHYEPYRQHARSPYKTVYGSLMALKHMFGGNEPFHVVPWVELFNYRYPMNYRTKLKYIASQLNAVHDAESDGWYAWSAGNKYGPLFAVLRAKMTKARAVYHETVKRA